MTKRRLRSGTAGNDTFMAGREAEVFQGLDGIDTVSYANSSAGVIVDIRGKTPGDGGAAEGDLYESIENFIGSRHRDVLFGSAGDNVLSGLGGHDRLNGFAGRDTLFGGDGNDQLRGGTDADVLHGERGSDFITGNAGNDVLHGGPGADTLLGGAGNDTIYSGAGDDFLEGEGIADDEEAADPGADVFHFNLAAPMGSDHTYRLSSG